MKKHHVALFYSQSLLGEGLQHLLSKLLDMNILGPWLIDESALQHINTQLPDIILIAVESIGEHDSHLYGAALLTAQILEKHVGLPVVQVLLEQNQVRIYNSQTIPARGADLIEAIRNLGAQTENL
ncbi:MAG: hypothetical protein AB1894_15305 [Chloroflexota bacterium]